MNIPKGWKLMPLDLTDLMEDAMSSASENCDSMHIVYEAALAAAPTPPAPENPWQQAVLNECMSIEGCYKESDPAGTMKCLTDWHVANERDHTNAQDDELVAWIIKNDEGDYIVPRTGTSDYLTENSGVTRIPLYTHPDSELRKDAERSVAG